MSAGTRAVTRKSVALTVLAAAVCAGCLTGAVTARPGPEKPAAEAISWGPCDRPDMPVPQGVQCGSIRVPVDWAKPQSGSVTLRAYRFKAAGPSKSKGTILNFPSGPGQTGDIAFATLRKHLPGYDLIALDPRGVGQSGPLNCATDKILKIPYVPPTDPGKFRALEKNQRSFWPTCATTPIGLKDHLDAYSNARDAEALREAMHLDKINLHGFSYGTLTAERYLGLYGDHVNGSVLEGVMNPAQSRREFVTSAARGIEAIFDRFRDWCADEAACALHGRDVAAVFRKAQQQADDGHIDGSLMTTPWSSVAVTRYFELTAPHSFEDTAAGLEKLSEGKNPMPGDEDPDQGQMPKTFPYADPIVCSDFGLSVKNVQQARHDLKATRKAAPVLGFSTNSNNYTSICLAGPPPAKGSGKPVTSRSAHPTMLLSNTLDPATPIAWANSVARQLSHKAIQVRTDQVGHGRGLENPETKRQVVTYLDQANRSGR